MDTLPRGNGRKLMTTGGAAKAQVLDSCPLHYYASAMSNDQTGVESMSNRIVVTTA